MTEVSAEIDMLDPRFRADPYPTYARMRREMPVCKVDVPGFGRTAWVVTRYEDVAAALKDPRLSSDLVRLRSENGAARWIPRPFRGT